MNPNVTTMKLDRYVHGFSTRNRVTRLFWKLVQATIFRWSPPSSHGLRRALLRSFGARIHKTALIYPTVRIWAPWNLEMGPHSCISWGVDCYSVDIIRLKEQAMVSQYARLITASHNVSSPNFELVHQPIELESESWVCAYAYVGMGVTVGRGAVVAATATAVKDVEAWSIVGGNPAKRIGTRKIGEENL